MSVTDADALVEVMWRVVDDATFTSGLWTLAEVAALFNQRQNRFNRDTKLLLAQVPIAVSSGVAEFDLPQDWIATQRATWRPAGAATVVTPVRVSDRFAAANGIPSVGGPTVPTIMDDQSSPNGPLKGILYPTPTTDGTVGLLYASLLELLNFDPNNPDIFDVPDEFVPYVVYGVLADMLGKEGRGQDLVRAGYCAERYDEGVALAGILLGGFF